MSCVTRKLVFGGCTTTEDGQGLEIADLDCRRVVLCSKNKGTDQLRVLGAVDLRLCFRKCK